MSEFAGWRRGFFPSALVLVKPGKGIQASGKSKLPTSMANEHPFQMLFESLGRLPGAHSESVNRRAYEILYDILSVPVEKAGRCVLLRAPRAGHGKTHLLSRIQHHLGASHEFIPLHAAFGTRIDAASVIDDALRRLLRPLPASGGLCVLDLVTRRLFSLALQPLVTSGEVPCQDRDGALTALRTRPIETFDFHHPNAVTAHWARENFEVLGQRLSVEIAQRCNLPVREVAFWVDALFRFGATPLENPIRLRVLSDAVHAGTPGEGILMERLGALLGMLAQLMRVVVVADDLEGFSSDETAALKLAAFIGSLRQSVERLDVILSINQDIWESAFVPRLSGGLADRLSEVVIELEPLTEEEMLALLESRVPGLGARVLERVDRNEAGNHARGLIRAAGLAWLRASASDSVSHAPPPINVPVVASDRKPDPTPAIESPVADVPVIAEEPSVEPGTESDSQTGGGSAAEEYHAPTYQSPEVPVYSVAPGFKNEPPVAQPDSSEKQPPAPDFTAPEPASQPPVDSQPFQKAPAEPWPTPTERDTPEFVPAQEPFVAARPEPSVEAPDHGSGAEAESGPISDPIFPPDESRPSDAVPDTDRVDDLLRQFRDRYGRGGG